MYHKEVDREKIILIPENFEDLKEVKSFLLKKSLTISKSWRDTYFGFKERDLKQEIVKVYDVEFEDLLSLKVSSRTNSGAKRPIKLKLNQELEISGDKDWYKSKKWSPTEALYYVGLDSSQLIYGSVRSGQFFRDGEEHFKLKQTNIVDLKEKVEKIVKTAKEEGFDKIYFLRIKPFSQIEISGINNQPLYSDYCDRAWTSISEAWISKDKELCAFLRQRLKGLIEVGEKKIEYLRELGNIKRIYVPSNLSVKIVKKISELGLMDLVTILEKHVFTRYDGEVLVCRYF